MEFTIRSKLNVYVLHHLPTPTQVLNPKIEGNRKYLEVFIWIADFNNTFDMILQSVGY